jgi:tRNA pseudouridine65 synthase
MWSIHPNQILPIVEAMRPDFSEVQAAAEILIAAQDKDWGPIQHDGKLHDRASYRYYWELLERAHVTGMEIPPPPRAVSLPDELPVLYRDEQIVVIDKPPNLLVHRSEIDRHETRFAIQILRDQIGQPGLAGPPTRPRHLRRTALRPEPDIASRSRPPVRKPARWKSGYWAVVRGHPPAAGSIDHPLSRQRDAYEFQGEQCSTRRRRRLTHFRKLAEIELPVAVDRYPSSRYALLELEPLTGRRHQMRRHLKHIAHPIIGDATYGKGRHNRFFAEHLGLPPAAAGLHRTELRPPAGRPAPANKSASVRQFAATLARFGLG